MARIENVLVYETILVDVLAPHNFQAQEAYEDSFGGQVLDFLRSKDRLTYVFAETTVQVLSFIDGKLATRLFEDPESSKIPILEYTEEMLR